MENISELFGCFDVLWHYDYAVGVRCEAFCITIDERIVVETLILHNLYINVEVAPYLYSLLHALFNLLPIGFRLMLWYERIEHV